MTKLNCQLGDGTICKNPIYVGCIQALVCSEHCRCKWTKKSQELVRVKQDEKVDNSFASPGKVLHSNYQSS